VLQIVGLLLVFYVISQGNVATLFVVWRDL